MNPKVFEKPKTNINIVKEYGTQNNTDSKAEPHTKFENAMARPECLDANFIFLQSLKALMQLSFLFHLDPLNHLLFLYPDFRY